VQAEDFEGALLSMHEPGPDPRVRSDPARRWKWLGVLSVAALLLHAAALSGIEWAWPSREVPGAPVGPVQVRVVEVAPATEPVAVAPPVLPRPTPEPEKAAAPPVRAKSVPPRAAPRETAAPPEVATVVPPTLADVPAAAAPAQVALTAPTPGVTPAAATAAGDEPIPHYRTRMPPATTLRYEMRRGVLTGIGDLSWRPRGEQYELRLEASVGGLPVLIQASTGGFDADGVAPVRFTDQRLRRGTTAANFQRAAAKITFSGPSTEFALRDGAQDRLSWMVQLAAIVAAEPRLGLPGAKVAMYVVGSHGDADVWVFRCLGPERVATGAGSVEAIKFMREARETYDTTVQVWLDPGRHGLPVRALQKSGTNDADFDLRLREVVAN
jgi:Protein of unknown function (DUF3108)